MSPPNNLNLISPSSILRFAPPPLPLDAIYTSCYCEENIYLLAETFARIAQRDKAAFPWDVYVVFISNRDKMVALWCQKVRQDVVVWDYHVILVLRPRSRSLAEPRVDLDMHENAWPSDLVSWVYDFDSRLPAPVPATCRY
ncbi:hypothetical protein QCA50_007822 [Cerrena zonata]|uniref:Protein N-terminal glutamine amidohydrolase n=1 Tax=Cerrena zonata TaxID=2478898 RepID=A0AAW0GI56_9APHY